MIFTNKPTNNEKSPSSPVFAPLGEVCTTYHPVILNFISFKMDFGLCKKISGMVLQEMLGKLAPKKKIQNNIKFKYWTQNHVTVI